MKKQAKKVITGIALAVGIGIGFMGALAPRTADAAWPGPAQCTKDSQCDAICGGAGWGDCIAFKCYCLR